MGNQAEVRRGSFIYGREFFSRSPFGSIPFLLASALLVFDLGYGFYLEYEHWTVLSSKASVVVTAAFLITVYRSTLYRFGMLRTASDAQGSVENATNAPRLDIALNVAAGTAEILSYLNLIVAGFLVLIDTLLRRLGS